MFTHIERMMKMIIDCLLDALHDSIKLVPFLLLTYFLMEELEHHTGGKVQQRIRQAGDLGPLWAVFLESFRNVDFQLLHPVCMQEESLQ